jgi:hypothetical protein
MVTQCIGEVSNFPWLRATFLLMLVYRAVYYSKPDQANVTRAVLLVTKEAIDNAFPRVPPPQPAVVSSAHSVLVHLLKL